MLKAALTPASPAIRDPRKLQMILGEVIDAVQHVTGHVHPFKWQQIPKATEDPELVHGLIEMSCDELVSFVEMEDIDKRLAVLTLPPNLVLGPATNTDPYVLAVVLDLLIDAHGLGNARHSPSGALLICLDPNLGRSEAADFVSKWRLWGNHMSSGKSHGGGRNSDRRTNLNPARSAKCGKLTFDFRSQAKQWIASNKQFKLRIDSATSARNSTSTIG